MFAHVPTQDSGQWLVLSVWKQRLGDTLLSCKAEDCWPFLPASCGSGAFLGPVIFSAQTCSKSGHHCHFDMTLRPPFSHFHSLGSKCVKIYHFYVANLSPCACRVETVLTVVAVVRRAGDQPSVVSNLFYFNY